MVCARKNKVGNWRYYKYYKFYISNTDFYKYYGFYIGNKYWTTYKKHIWNAYNASKKHTQFELTN